MSTQAQPGRYNLAGWFSLVQAILNLSLGLLFFIFTPGGEQPVPPVFITLRICGALAGAGLLVYVFKSFRRLLNVEFEYHKADFFILFLIWMNLIFILVSTLFDSLFPSPKAWLAVNLFFLPGMGIIMIILARKLLQAPGWLYGLHKPYCWALLIQGGSLVLVVTVPLAVAAGVVSWGLLGMIFFRASDPESLRENEQ